MSFSARLESDLVSVEAGATVPIGIQVTNSSEALDRFEVQIEGLDPEWTAVPVPLFPVNPGETQAEKLFFKPPRASESLAGNYPFVVRVRSMETGESRTVQGVLQIKPFHHLSLELNPKRGAVSPWRSQNDFHVTVINLGNTEHTLQLYGNDPDEALAFEFEQEQVTVGPGQQKTVEVFVDPTTRRLFASSRLFMFSISARSVQQSSIVATSQAQLEQRPLLSPASLAIIFLFAIVASLWFYMRPKPPTIDHVDISPDSVMIGQPVTIKWDASNVAKVNVKIEGVALQDDFKPHDQLTYTPRSEGILPVEIIAQGETKFVTRKLSIQVTAPTPAGMPIIKEFSISPTNMKLNDTFVVKYSVQDATKITLEPTGIELDPSVSSKELQASRTGRIEYILKAWNKDGKFTDKRITINVEDPTLGKIENVTVSPKELPEEGGTATISWTLVNCVRAEIQIGDMQPESAQTAGSRDITVTQTTSITITGWDIQNRKVTKTVKIVVKQPPPPPDPNSGGEPPAGGTG